MAGKALNKLVGLAKRSWLGFGSLEGLGFARSAERLSSR